MSKRILIVEDDPFIADDLHRILSGAGYTIVATPDNPVDAMTAVTSGNPDLILLDINLNAALDGVDLAHKVRSTGPLPFIFISANIDAATLSRVAFAEPQGFISKPYNEADVLIGVQLALARSGTQQVAPAPETYESVQFVKANTGLERIEVEDIQYLEANDYYCYLHLPDRRVLVTATLGQTVQQLNLPFLVKIHRSYYVNIRQVKRIVGNELEVNGTRLPIARSQKEEFLKKVSLL